MAPKKASSSKASSVFPSGWEWVQEIKGLVQGEAINEANLQSSYLFGAPKCETNACRTNCKKNPSCHNGLGEKFWFGEIKDNFWVDIEDPEEQRKQKGSHVGLKNLGATCYVNTFLQLWFHNLEFRNAIFKWVPSEGYNFSASNDRKTDERNKEESEEEHQKHNDDENVLPMLENIPPPGFGSSVPDIICGNLQLLFALMKHSDKRFVDPTPFVESLGLQTDEQQDAQEFSKLFMSLLEETLSNQQNNVKRLVQDQFGGKYAYVTCCSKCGKSSKNESRFYELDLNIQGHQMLTECIKEFLKEEKLDGDNKYFCTNCQEKQDATRKIVLQSLPPVLNLQLLRFVFDRNTGSKSKCNSFVKFPDTLDMNNFVTLDNPAHGKYELTAVLIHVGHSAYSGHYVAHILDKKDETWHRFNDEIVDKMQGKKLQLGAEDDPEAPEPTGKPAKKPKTTKGCHGSKNAYMLVYCRKGQSNCEAASVDPPDQVLEHVVKDNSLLDAWISDVNVLLEKTIQDGIKRQEDIKDIYKNMQPKEGEESEWVVTEWLRKLFNEKQTEVPPINNSSLMCKHARLDPCKVNLSKRISAYSGDRLFKKYGGIPRFKSDAICGKCVFGRARRIQFDARLEQDKKFLSAAAKTSENSGGGFWVGKSSLKQWKQLAINAQNFENPEAGSGHVSPSQSPKTDLNGHEDVEIADESNHDASDACLASPMPRTSVEGSAAEERSQVSPKRNELCSSSKRKLDETTSPNEAKLPKIDQPAENGSFASNDVHMNGETMNELPKPLIGSLLSDNQSKTKLFNYDITCSEHGNLSLDENKRRLVSGEAWSRLKYYFKDCPEFSAKETGCIHCQNQTAKKKERKEALKIIANDMKSVLMDLYLDVNRPTPNIQESFEIYAVSKDALDDWRHFIKFPKEPKYDMIENEDLICAHGKLLYNADDLLNPRPEEDFSLLNKDEWETLSGFIPCDKEITLINILETQEEGSSMLALTPECCQDCRSRRLNQDLENEKQFFYSPIYVRKVTDKDEVIEAGSLTPVEEAPEKSAKKKKFIHPTKGSRQSARHRTQRGEYMFRVDSSQTLKETKIQLLASFSVLPMDQHLSFEDGTPLADDTKTLGDLGVRPGCFLLLRVDEPTHQGRAVEEVTVNGKRKLEEGFKGTGLCGASQMNKS